MNRRDVIRRLKSNKVSLQALGLERVSLFGSMARGEATAASDIDLAVTLDADAKIDLFRFAAISEQVARMLGAPVDLVVEPARNRARVRGCLIASACSMYWTMMPSRSSDVRPKRG